jgi:hypothetical protein
LRDHRTLARWVDDGLSYSVSVHLENGKPTGLTIEAISRDGTRCATLPIDFGSSEWYGEVWSESKPAKKLTVAAERALALAERMGYGD